MAKKPKKGLNIVAIIPARMASTRFPGKPLAKIHGKPMIQWCWEASKKAKIVNEAYIATCDREIIEAAKKFGAKAVMTSIRHKRASDRTAEAVLKIENQTGKKVDIVVMIQGDEPMITPKMIEDATKALIDDKSVNVVNLMGKLETAEEFEDPNEVKVVVDKNNNALYFSREPIPSRKKGVSNVPMHKQVCIIPFRRDFLMKYNKMKQTPLEIIESVDMMRVLENGQKVKMVYTDRITYSVDTPQDLRDVEKCQKDKIKQCDS